jgi:hypothetical protein
MLGLAAAALSGSRARAGDDRTPANEDTVEYRTVSTSRFTESIASIEFSSSSRSRVGLRDGKKLDATWTAFEGPLHPIRVVESGGTVRWFQTSGKKLLPIGSELVLARADGAPDVPAMFLRDQKPKPLETAVSEFNYHALVLLGPNRADWVDEAVGRECGYTKSTDGSILVALRDGKKLVFEQTPGGWRERKQRVWLVSESERLGRNACRAHLQTLIDAFDETAPKDRARSQALSGIAWFAQLARSRADLLPEAFFCPADPHAKAPSNETEVAAWRRVIASEPPGGDACSYATRDFSRFPLDPKALERQAIMCCRCGRDGRSPHHHGGLFVAFERGEVRWMDAFELGQDGEIVVGPDSKSPVLRTMVHRPAAK